MDDVANFAQNLLQKIAEQANNRDLIFEGQRPAEDDYGYNKTNPICTSSITYSDKYLANLRTLDGQKISWKRKGCTCMPKCNGVENVMVDTYQLYLNGNPFNEIHICPYAHNSSFAPKGFILADEYTSTTNSTNKTYIVNNDETIIKHQDRPVYKIPTENTKVEKLPKPYTPWKTNPFIFFSEIAVAICNTIVSILMVATAKKVSLSTWDTEWIFISTSIILILANVYFAISEKKYPINKVACIIITFIIALLEFTLIALLPTSAFRIKKTRTIATSTFYILGGAHLISPLYFLVHPFLDKYYSSISYKEKCYAKMEKMHNYHEKGIISEEEYLKSIEEIKRKIKN